jgi:hypothetical protein
MRIGCLALVTGALLCLLLSVPPTAAAEKEVHIALSFPNGVVWPYFSVATEMGYASEEGIAFKLTSTTRSLSRRRC